MTEEEIMKYLSLEDTSRSKSDLAFIFGNTHAQDEAVKKTYELYRDGFIQNIICTGGPSKTNPNITEAQSIKDKLVALGLPPSNIYTEDRSTNTLENVVFGREKIPHISEVKTITLVVRTYHARRALMTIKKHMPSHIHYFIAPYTPKQDEVEQDSQSTNHAMKAKIVREFNNIKHYLDKGDIAEA